MHPAGYTRVGVVVGEGVGVTVTVDVEVGKTVSVNVGKRVGIVDGITLSDVGWNVFCKLFSDIVQA